ncbi:hypothetical protein M569_14089, partial [Genlisea aurea]
SPAPDQAADNIGSISGAKYKLMSPAKLPISRSTCITIPPGLSPTSFLESPVLLSYIKAEPSPTTGSFFKPHVMPRTGENPALPLENKFAASKDVNGGTLNGFESQFHAGGSSTSGIPSAGLQVPGVSNRNGPASDQDHCISQAHTTLSSSSQAARGGDDSAVCRPTEGFIQEGLMASSDHKDSVPSSASGERTSDDGYNWRKYGQKLVKGSEFPRSYYKCTYPNCEVKKIFERSPGGQITEIVYKGSHVHPKPQAAARRQSPAFPWSVPEDRLNKDFQFTGHEDKFNVNTADQNGSPAVSPLQANEDAADGSQQPPLVNEDNDEDDPFLKKRKIEDCMDVTTPVVKPIREPRVVVQTLSEVDILDDGYRWRKYGQKVVRGNPNPRSYYKCTNSGCPVRKHVERASHDPKAVITTYEGKHNHDVPAGRSNNNHDSGGGTPAAPYVLTSKMRPPQDGGGGTSITLDLGFGIGRTRTSDEE